MTLQAKLTLGFVILVVLMVAFISAVDLIINMDQQFDATLDSARFLVKLATKYVRTTLNSQLQATVPEALADKELSTDLVELLAKGQGILEIAGVDPNTNEVLADTDPARVRTKLEKYPDFEHLVVQSGWLTRAQELRKSGVESYYKMEQPLMTSSGETVVIVRVLINLTLIRDDMMPALRKNAKLALISVGGALTITFLFSAAVFRPLARLRS